MLHGQYYLLLLGSDTLILVEFCDIGILGQRRVDLYRLRWIELRVLDLFPVRFVVSQVTRVFVQTPITYKMCKSLVLRER